MTRYIGDMHREIDSLEARLQSLRSATAERANAPRPAAAWRRGPGRPPGSGARKAGRRAAALTPEQRASRQLQGRYLGLIRQIPATRRGQYARIAKEKGREAAIKEMTNALNK